MDKNKIVPFFLDKDLIAKIEKHDFYSLNKEFIKTTKNKSKKLYSVLIIFVFSLFISTIVLAGFIKNQTRQLDIDISDFQDINLKEIVSIARDATELVNKAQADKEVMKERYENAIDQLHIQFAKEKSKIEQDAGLSDEEKARLLSELKNKQAHELQLLQQSHERKLTEKEKEITLYKKQLQEYERSMKDSLRSSQKDYESKLEFMKEENIKKIRALEQTLALKDSQLRELQEKFEREMSTVSIRNQKELQDLKLSLKQESDRLDLLRISLEDKNNELNKLKILLGKYRFAVQHRTSNRGEHGYVIDARDPGNILLAINPLIQCGENDEALVLNDDNALIAILKIQHMDDLTKAIILKRINSEPIKPFHKIIIKRQRSGKK